MLIIGDCREEMRKLITEGVKVQMCVTSPPYFGLRAYLPKEHPYKAKELGTEKTPEDYVANMVEVFNLVRELLNDNGVLWLNIGDSYAGSGSPGGDFRDGKGGDVYLRPYNRKGEGIKPKDLIGIPWMVAFALRSAGWYLRQDIVWHKPNPMPESVTDRCTKSHEYLFLFAKSQKYYYDNDAIREPHKTKIGPPREYSKEKYNNAYLSSRGKGLRTMYSKIGRNKRSVWTVSTKPYKGSHFATFPTELIEPCVLAGSKEGDTVIDPFFGSGTVGEVCNKFGRKWIGIDLNAEYKSLQKNRTAQQYLEFGRAV